VGIGDSTRLHGSHLGDSVARVSPGRRQEWPQAIVLHAQQLEPAFTRCRRDLNAQLLGPMPVGPRIDPGRGDRGAAVCCMRIEARAEHFPGLTGDGHEVHPVAEARAHEQALLHGCRPVGFRDEGALHSLLAVGATAIVAVDGERVGAGCVRTDEARMRRPRYDRHAAHLDGRGASGDTRVGNDLRPRSRRAREEREPDDGWRPDRPDPRASRGRPRDTGRVPERHHRHVSFAFASQAPRYRAAVTVASSTCLALATAASRFRTSPRARDASVFAAMAAFLAPSTGP